uniref:Uncharacterized protein n=1 Tax=Hordeum vulgare subsp. vulgare TaxID=112509 RepID=A0A8I6WUB3_HORVV
MLKRADYFLHLILQSAPIVIAHEDVELRYRYIFNHFPTLADEVNSFAIDFSAPYSALLFNPEIKLYFCLVHNLFSGCYW